MILLFHDYVVAVLGAIFLIRIELELILNTANRHLRAGGWWLFVIKIIDFWISNRN